MSCLIEVVRPATGGPSTTRQRRFFLRSASDSGSSEGSSGGVQNLFGEGRKVFLHIDILSNKHFKSIVPFQPSTFTASRYPSGVPASSLMSLDTEPQVIQSFPFVLYFPICGCIFRAIALILLPTNLGMGVSYFGNFRARITNCP